MRHENEIFVAIKAPVDIDFNLCPYWNIITPATE